ncbi:MAG: Na/Pi cotransporter family protein, partial [Clostridia bacterium]|nr:Na/Pi cotransporter family protein [Clostridia bacterium]
GQNIGTCVTALLSSVGANKNARKTAVTHLSFNVLGMLIFLPLIYFGQKLLPFYNDPITKSGIANFHLIFNICNTLVLLPFSKGLVKISKLLVMEEKEEVRQTGLDSRFLGTPALAVLQASRETVNMAFCAMENMDYAQSAILAGDTSKKDVVYENEERIDEYESGITRYLMQIVDTNLNETDSKTTSGLFHILIDIERVGDRCQSLFDIGEKIQKNHIQFSEKAKQELSVVMNAAKEIFASSILAYEQRNLELAHRIQTYENVIDDMRRTLRDNHVDRLANQDCNLEAAVIFLDVLGHLERIADHGANIANRIEQMLTENNAFDLHKDVKAFRNEHPEQYLAYYKEFEEKYSIS